MPDARTEPVAERYRDWQLDELLEAMATRPVVQFLGSYRSTSPVYRLELEGGLQIAFKPGVPDQETRWVHEVVAYRLARVLGLGSRMPPVVVRSVPASALGWAGRNDDLVRDPNDETRILGAAIVWLPVLRRTGLSLPEQRAIWERWLDPSQPQPRGADAALAEEISTVLVFDYLQANEDRWNEANVRTDEYDHIVYRDNNVGWFPRKMRALAWGETRLHLAGRFSRRFVAAIEQAGVDRLRDELARGQREGVALTTERVLRYYEIRRRAVLAYVAEMRTQHGDAAVFFEDAR